MVADRTSPSRGRRNLQRLTCLMLTLVAACCARQVAPQSAQAQRAPGLYDQPHVTLIALTDWQAVLKPCGCTVDLQKGGIERIAHYLDDLGKTDNSLFVVHAGSLLGEDEIADGRAAQVERRVQAFDESLGPLGLGAVALCGADLDKGGAWVSKTYNSASWPVLGTATWNGGVTRAKPFMLHKTRSGVTVGVLAVDPSALPEDEARQASVRASVADLRARGAGVVVVLSNLGRRASRRLARAVPGIDVMVAGSLDAKAEPVADLEREGDTLLVEASRHGAWFAALTLVPAGGSGGWREVSEFVPGAAKDLEERISSLDANLHTWRGKATLATERALPQFEADLGALRQRLEVARKATTKTLPAGRLVAYRMIGLPWSVAIDQRVAAIVKRYDDDIAYLNLRAAGAVPLPAPGEAGYVGQKVCLECHEAAAMFAMSDPHTKAWATLERVSKTHDLDCVPCHVTGYGKAGGSNLGHLDNLTAVLCEACHGAGSLHVQAEQAGKSGHILASPGVAQCEVCHTPVHAPRFAFDDYRKRLLAPGHGAPKAAGAKP